MASLTALALVLALAAALAARSPRPPPPPPRVPYVAAREVISSANGRTILVGENHVDRDGLRKILSLMRHAHEAGYRTLGVEVCEEGSGKYRGLRDELALLRCLGNGMLSEDDDRSCMDAGPDGRTRRMNRYWQMQLALRLGWRIVPIDPHHWNWQSETAEGYLDSREPAMADAIGAGGPMIAVCGYGHLAGLCALGIDAIVTISCDPRESDVSAAFWKDRIRFAKTVPRLVA